MRKNLKLIIALIIVIDLGSLIYINRPIYGNTPENRVKILNQNKKGISVISETKTDDFILCEIKDQNNNYGFAVFVPSEKGNYEFQTKILRGEDQISTLLVNVNNDLFEISICNKPNLDYAEINYYNTSDLSLISSEKIKVIDGKYAYTKVPDIKEYNREIVFFDIDGNKYE